MGTSQSSGGPGGGVPMVPPWTPDPPTDDAPEPGPDEDGAPDEPASPEPNAPSSAPANAPLAPAGRFRGARRALGDYSRLGHRDELRSGLGHYVRSGYGGSATATRRFGGTATTAGVLGDALASVAAGQASAPGSPLDPTLLAGRTAQEVMDAVIEAVRPVDGTQDAEAERASIRDALSELLTRFPEADLLNLEADQRDYAIERFAAIDVFRRFELDLGKTIVDKSPSATAALGRLKEVRDYIKQGVAASFRRLRDAGRTLTSGRIGKVVQDALQETFEIFEGYVE